MILTYSCPHLSRWSDVTARNSPVRACFNYWWVLALATVPALLSRCRLPPQLFFALHQCCENTRWHAAARAQLFNLCIVPPPHAGALGLLMGIYWGEEGSRVGREGTVSADARVSSLMLQLSAQMRPPLQVLLQSLMTHWGHCDSWTSRPDVEVPLDEISSWALPFGWLLDPKYVHSVIQWVLAKENALHLVLHVWRVETGRKNVQWKRAILHLLSRGEWLEHSVRWEQWWSRSRQMGRGGSFRALQFHAGGPGCRDCQCMVNYLNLECGKGNGCICHRSFKAHPADVFTHHPN